MFRNHFVKTIALLLAVGLATQVHASVSLDVDSAEFLGVVSPDTPANEDAEVSYINNLITVDAGDLILVGDADDFDDGQNYDRTESDLAGPFDPAETTDSFRQEGSDTTLTLTDTYQYITAKYGADKGGLLVWYFEEGITGDVILPSSYDNPNDDGGAVGLSHSTAYNGTAIPEPASVVVWGLFAFGGVFLARRRTRA